MNTTSNPNSGEKGFTLVELAIVMIIIGLLIGGILKGQELIANARLASAVSKVKAIDAAINTFRDSFSGLPGDTLSTRLPNCGTGTKCGAIGVTTAGLGNNIIGTATQTDPGAVQASTSEMIVAWAQLSAADMMGGVQNGLAADNVTSGVTVPEAEVPGQIFIGYSSGAALPTGYTGVQAPVRAGHYLLIHNGATGAASSAAANGTAGTGTVSLTPNQAARIDAKLDDNSPASGSVLPMGANGSTGCWTTGTTAVPAAYNTGTVQAAACGLYIRIQQ